MASSFHSNGPITASAMATEEELVAANGRVSFFWRRYLIFYRTVYLVY